MEGFASAQCRCSGLASGSERTIPAASIHDVQQRRLPKGWRRLLKQPSQNNSRLRAGPIADAIGKDRLLCQAALAEPTQASTDSFPRGPHWEVS